MTALLQKVLIDKDARDKQTLPTVSADLASQYQPWLPEDN